MITKRAFLAWAFVAAVGLCQSNVQRPTTGYVLDQSGTLRPVLGIPGAAVLGDRVAPAISFSTALAVPQRDFVIGLPAGGGSAPVLVTGLATGAAVVTEIPGAIRADRIARNEAGTAAVTYSSRSRQLQLISGLPSAPACSEAISFGFDAPLTALALQGNTVVFATSDGTAGGLYYLAAARRRPVPRYVAPVGRATAIAFLNGGADMAIADDISNEVIILRSFRTTGAEMVFATAKDGLSRPISIRVVHDHLFIGSAGSSSVLICDLTTNSITEAPLRVAPTRMDQVSGEWMALNDPRDGVPLYLINALTNEIVFVPASR